MANLMSLPCEIINHILIQENIDMEDVVNLSLTCKGLYTAINNDYLWRRKLFQRWPSLKKIHVDCLNNDENIKEMVKEGMKYEKELLRCLSILPYIYDAKDTNETFRRHVCHVGFVYQTIGNTSSLKYYYCHDKLIQLMEADPLDKYINLTHMYYAKKFIVLMKQVDGRKAWRKLQHLPYRQQTAEQVATLVAQWCQPYKLVFHSDIAASLDIIVQQILKVLKDVHPAHSVFATSTDLFSFWKNNITDNYWNVQESRQIIDIIGRVIFRELNFICCANSKETCMDPKIFFIDQVLESKRASPILLQIIIQSVARRLGVRCDLLYSSSNLLLSWRESYNNWTECYYTVLFSDGSLIIKEVFRHHPFDVDPPKCFRNCSNCPWEIDTDIMHYMQPVTPLKLVLCLTKNLVNISGYTDKCVTQTCWVSELVVMVQQSDGNELSVFRTIWFPALSYMTPHCLGECENGILCMLSVAKMSAVLSHKQNIHSRLTRKHLKYSIGMLVEIQSPFKCAGVITGWKSNCSNCHLYLSWPRFDHASAPTMCTQSYTILACDDIELNVSQEFLKPLNMQKWINNTEIGQYFSHFEGTHYVPNQKLQMLYPMDMHILQRKYSMDMHILKKSKCICYFKDRNVS